MLPCQNSCSCPAADVTTTIAREDREGTEVKVNFTYRDLQELLYAIGMSKCVKATRRYLYASQQFAKELPFLEVNKCMSKLKDSLSKWRLI